MVKILSYGGGGLPRLRPGCVRDTRSSWWNSSVSLTATLKALCLYAICIQADLVHLSIKSKDREEKLTFQVHFRKSVYSCWTRRTWWSPSRGTRTRALGTLVKITFYQWCGMRIQPIQGFVITISYEYLKIKEMASHIIFLKIRIHKGLVPDCQMLLFSATYEKVCLK